MRAAADASETRQVVLMVLLLAMTVRVVRPTLGLQQLTSGVHWTLPAAAVVVVLVHVVVLIVVLVVAVAAVPFAPHPPPLPHHHHHPC